MDHLDDESLLARLPRRHDDEPPTLRQDLLDEVRDYLQSAWEEEQRQTPDPHEAWQLVLQRFGDPAKLVRKLWFDALKEQIMSRRLILAALGLAAVMFVAFAAINLRMLSALETTLAGAQKTNALLVEKLEALQRPPVETASVLRHIRLRLMSEDGQPVAGRAILWGSPFGPDGSREPCLTESGQLVQRGKLVLPIEASGEVKFGPIPVGNYDIDVELDNGLATRIYNVNLLPDAAADVEREIRVPQRLRGHSRVQLTWQSPEPVLPAGKAYDPRPWLLCQLQELGYEGSGGTLWRQPGVTDRKVILLLSPTGETFQVEWDFNDGEEIDGPDFVTVRGLATDALVLGLTDKVWDGRLPLGSLYEITSTELVRLVEHLPESSKWHFECMQGLDSRLPDVGTSERRGIRFAVPATSATEAPLQVQVPVSPESVDGLLRLRRPLTLVEAQQYLVPPPGGMGGQANSGGGSGGGFF